MNSVASEPMSRNCVNNLLHFWGRTRLPGKRIQVKLRLILTNHSLLNEYDIFFSLHGRKERPHDILAGMDRLAVPVANRLNSP